jgi:hypothetical protein
MTSSGGYNYITQYHGDQYIHNDELHQQSRREHVLHYEHVNNRKKHKGSNNAQDYDYMTEIERHHLYLEEKRHLAVIFENNAMDREFQELQEKIEREKQAELQLEKEMQLVNTIVSENRMSEIDRIYLRVYGRRVRLKQKYFSPMYPSFVHNGLFKGIPLMSSGVVLTKNTIQRNNHWLEEEKGQMTTENEKKTEKKIVKKMKEQKEEVIFSGGKRRVLPFVYTKKMFTYVHCGVYKMYSMVCGGVVKKMMKKKKQEKTKKKKEISISSSSSSSSALGQSNNKKNMLMSNTRDKYVLYMKGRDISSRNEQMFLRRSEIHITKIDVSSEIDQYQKKQKQKIDLKIDPNDWRPTLVLHLFRPIEYVSMVGADLSFSLNSADFKKAKRSLPLRFSRPTHSWWKMVSKNLKLNVIRQRVITRRRKSTNIDTCSTNFHSSWCSSQEEKRKLNQGYRNDGYCDNGITLRSKEKKNDTNTPDTTDTTDTTDTSCVRIPRYSGVRLHNGIYKKHVLISASIVSGYHLWNRSRINKEPGMNRQYQQQQQKTKNMTKKKTEQHSSSNSYTASNNARRKREVRRPRVYVNGGVYKTRTLWNGWTQPNQQSIIAPTLHTGITKAINGQYVTLHGGE